MIDLKLNILIFKMKFFKIKFKKRSMKKFFLLASVAILLFSACSPTSTKEACGTCDGIFSTTVTMFVNEQYTTCDSGVTKKCNLVQFADTINEANWVPFKDSICGFDFVPGYRYKLLVKRQKTGKDEAGDNIYRYCLMTVENMDQVYLK